MKQAVSVSLGSATRDEESVLSLLGQSILLRREGMDGDVARATARFEELDRDSKVGALGAGGVDLWVGTDKWRYPLRSAQKMVRGVQNTAVVDGSGLKLTLERGLAGFLAEAGVTVKQKRVLVTSAIDRYGMARSFQEAGWETLYGDLGFALGLPLPLRQLAQVARVARLLLPLVSHLPMRFLYPTGTKQVEIVPKFGEWYAWAEVIAGDCLFIKRHMPADLREKVIVTNTTTAVDRALFAERGVRYLVTSTPVVNGRSFGTNLLEAGLTTAVGQNRPLTVSELQQLLPDLGLRPTLLKL